MCCFLCAGQTSELNVSQRMMQHYLVLPLCLCVLNSIKFSKQETMRLAHNKLIEHNVVWLVSKRMTIWYDEQLTNHERTMHYPLSRKRCNMAEWVVSCHPAVSHLLILLESIVQMTAIHLLSFFLSHLGYFVHFLG